MDPVEVEITNYDDSYSKEEEKPNFKHKISTSKFIYLDKEDVRL